MKRDRLARRRPLRFEHLDPRLVLSINPSMVDVGGAWGSAANVESYPDRTSFLNLSVPTTDADPAVAAANFLRAFHTELGLPANVAEHLEVREVKHGLASTHVRFSQTFDGIAVNETFISVHMNAQGVIQTVHNAYRDMPVAKTSRTPQVALPTAIQAAEHFAGIESTFADPRSELVWNVGKDGSASLAWRVTVYGHQPTGDFLTLVDAASGKVLQQENRMAFATGTGNVFEPNPYQTQGNGAGLSDSNDANSAALSSQMISVTLQGLDEGTGLLRGEFVNLSSLNSPDIPDIDANEPTRIYEYTRDDSRFEQVVVYHAVDQINRYFHALGFDDDSGTPNGIRDFPTLANAHWYTADNSFYSTGDDAIHFGDGGVDDAEDADIVAHEYGHAVQHDQNAFWGGGEMGAMGEGFGDYLAATFYADFGDSGFQANNAAAVGEWDATSYSSDNPPNLRRVDGDKMYPFDLSGGVHADGEIWSAALWDLRSALGAVTADQLILESHFALPGNATMRDGANAILAADASINGGANATDITFWFEERGILGDLPDDDHGNDFASATPIAVPSTTPGLVGIAGDVDYFAFAAVGGESYIVDVLLNSLSDSTLTLYGTNGTTQLAFDDDGGPGLASQIVWDAPASGTYFLKVAGYSTRVGSYGLDIDVSSGGSDDYGNSSVTAFPIALNSTVNGNIEVGSDQDWFAFTVPDGANVSLATSLGSLDDTTVALIDTDGTSQLAFDDDGGPGLASLINWTAPASGTYFAVVQSFGTGTGSYGLTLTSDRTGVTGDFNADGIYDCTDIDALVQTIVAASGDVAYDLTGDGFVDNLDLDAWLLEAGEVNLGSGIRYLYGDANLDAVVDVSDFNIWNDNKFEATGTWCQADFNADGSTDVSDFNIWNDNKFQSALPPLREGDRQPFVAGRVQEFVWDNHSAEVAPTNPRSTLVGLSSDRSFVDERDRLRSQPRVSQIIMERVFEDIEQG